MLQGSPQGFIVYLGYHNMGPIHAHCNSHPNRRIILPPLGTPCNRQAGCRTHRFNYAAPALALFSLTNLTKSSITLGQAPSSFQNPIVSSFRLSATNFIVMSHVSLLMLFFQCASRYSIHQASQGVAGVSQLTLGAVRSRRQYSIAASSCTLF